jgi:hypothetical protein
MRSATLAGQDVELRVEVSAEKDVTVSRTS